MYVTSHAKARIAERTNSVFSLQERLERVVMYGKTYQDLRRTSQLFKYLREKSKANRIAYVYEWMVYIFSETMTLITVHPVPKRFIPNDKKNYP